MQEMITYIHNFLDFAAVYCLTKCLKSMLCAIAVIPVIFLLRKIVGKKHAVISCYAMMMLVPITWTGMSKLYYQRYFVKVTIVISEHIKKEYGYFYFAGMFLLIVVFWYKNKRLKMHLAKSIQIKDSDVVRQAIDAITKEDKSGYRRKYLEHVRLYSIDTNESPFSGGIIRPYIVLPQSVWELADTRTCFVIVCHELLHIGSGHIVALTLFKILTFWWWANPLIYRCEAALREDLELVCDESCIFETQISRYEYGSVLLRMIEQLSGRQQAAVASLLNKNDFAVLRKRIGYLAKKQAGRFQIKKKVCFWVFAVSMIGVFIGIVVTSYPRYTIVKELAVYNEHVELIAYDTPLVRETFFVENGQLYVNPEKFEEFVMTQHITDEYVYVSFDNVMKLPGMGGLGNVGMVNVEDTEDIFYLSEKNIQNTILEFCLKYL